MTHLESIDEGLKANRPHNEIVRKIYLTYPTIVLVGNEERQFQILNEISEYFNVSIINIQVVGSEQEVADALSCRISFGKEDAPVIDWLSAVLLGKDMDDVRAVLDFANVELLEMRMLDEQLDRALDEGYEALSRKPRLLSLPGSHEKDVTHIAQLQVDSALIFERVTNTLKLLGDQYLARVYRLASQRFHLEAWDASILRKLQTLENIYGKMSDRAGARRMEVLEWIIIALIALSIAVSLFPIRSH